MQDWNWLRLSYYYFPQLFVSYGVYFEFSLSPSWCQPLLQLTIVIIIEALLDTSISNYVI